MRLLIVEDDENVGSALGAVLTRAGYETTWARTGQDALDQLGSGTDMVLLDLSLPDIDGFEVCRRVRRLSDAPVIMATARSQLDARIHGLEVGADDYMVKPYDLRELIARIEAISRRSRARLTGNGGRSAAVQIGAVCIDLASRQVTVGGRPVMLTKKEFDVVALLARHPGVVFPRERILREVWQTNWRGLGRSLEVHIAAIRRKLGSPDVIETVRGVGYRLANG